MPVVELAGVTKAYESKVAVRNLSLSIDAGQMFGLLGPNGAGKTSSIRMMMGITMPDSGTIRLFEKPFDRSSLERVGYLPEERGLYKKMKVIEQLVFFGELHGLSAVVIGHGREFRLVSSDLDAVGLRKDAGRGAAAVGGHDLESVFDGEKRFDCDDDPGTARIDNCLRAFKGGIGALQRCLGSGNAKFGLALDVLEDF